MARLDIITLPDPMLRQRSAPVDQVDGELRKLMDDMAETMYAAPGVGLAAVQVAVPRRLIVVDADAGTDDSEGEAIRRPLFLINPEIVARGEQLRHYEEGCLSLPDVLVEIERPATVSVSYIGRDGARAVLEAEGLLATVIQHEMDHLDGRLIIDFLTRLKRDIIIRRFKKKKRGAIPA